MARLVDAFEVFTNWRSAHSFPLNSIQMGLRQRVDLIDSRALVAQRLKRSSSILAKMRRFPGMRLSQMQDIGGCRAVVGSAPQVYALRDQYARSRSPHTFLREKDYVAEPQATGYRGIHRMYRFHSNRSTDWNGLQVEIQLRSRLQHAWATAVETVGILLRQSLKSNMGEGQWLRFFAQASAVFAEAEHAAPVPGVDLSGQELRQAVAHSLRSDNMATKLSGFGHALRVARTKSSGDSHYFLLALDPGNRRLSVTPFRREDLEEASESYLQKEREFEQVPGAEAVLVSTSSVRSLERAYPNYFLDTQVFIRRLQELCAVGAAERGARRAT